MIIETVQAGVISDAPSIYEILVRATQKILTFVGGLAVLSAMGSGIIYVVSSGNKEQQRFAKNTLTGSVIGLVIILTALIVVSSIVKVF